MLNQSKFCLPFDYLVTSLIKSSKAPKGEKKTLRPAHIGPEVVGSETSFEDGPVGRSDPHDASSQLSFYPLNLVSQPLPRIKNKLTECFVEKYTVYIYIYEVI